MTHPETPAFLPNNLIRPEFLPSPEEKPLAGHTIVTIGGSRGIGAAVNIRFAELGANIVTVHGDPQKEKRNKGVLDAIKKTGSSVKSIVGDITDSKIRDDVLRAALEFGPVFAVNINAAGGTLGTEEDARKLNIKTPQAIVDEFLPHMTARGFFLYPESLWSRFYENIRMLPDYERVARTKHEAAQYLREQRRMMEEKDVSLRFVCGHAVSGTFIVRIFSQRYQDEMTALKETCLGKEFPTVEDMAQAEVATALDSNRPFGDTIYVLGEGAWGYAPSKEWLKAYVQRINAALAPFNFEM